MDILALVAPSVNRVYGHAASALALEEFRFVAERVAPGALLDAGHTVEVGVPYLRLSVSDEAWEDPLARAELGRMLAFSPHVFAAFEEAGRMPILEPVFDGGEGSRGPGADASLADERLFVDEMPSVPLLQPLPLPAVERYGSELLTTLKYQGKTNEQFTALMIHLAAHTAGKGAKLADGTLRLLDPMAGRGTTLNQALMWGLSPVGVDIDKKDAEIFRAFLTSWMREGRLKHTAKSGKLTVHGKALGAHFHAELAASKEAQKRGHSQSLDLYTADATEMASFLKAKSADVIVADLPYGVQHGARSGGALKRSPLDLLEAALPALSRVLLAGGAAALAINRHTAPWEATARLLEDHGFTVVSTDGQFRHRVDSSIDRDIVLARRP